MIAVAPSMWMSAFIRTSSGTCMKRFSKIRSPIWLRPWACVSRAII